MEYIKQKWDEKETKRFMAGFVKNEESSCWEWVKSKDGAGYGFLYFEGKMQRSHRVFYSHFKEPVPIGKYRNDFCIDHICKNTSCCNPEHLRIVSSKENTVIYGTSLVSENAKKTHCKYGHELPTYNLEKTRYCKPCDNIRHKKRINGVDRNYWLAKNRANVKRYYERQKSKHLGASPS